MYCHIEYQRLSMLKVQRDINQQDFKIVDLHLVKFEYFFHSLWKLQLNNLAVERVKSYIIN